jgi:hypothetical protein
LRLLNANSLGVMDLYRVFEAKDLIIH